MKVSEILIAESASEPVVAYRKRSNSKPEKNDALATGKALENLVDYLPFNKYQSPPGLLDPRNTTEDIEGAAEGIRRTLGGEGFVVEVEALIRNCQSLKIVLGPVLWGGKGPQIQRHEHLPSDLRHELGFPQFGRKTHGFQVLDTP